ncbi:MAG TPA: hypothetical protein VGY57_07835 [Vicinamibacterales bacterium]|jgi:formylmethanofuran dehydrogenase subunit E|nr:hypothetical protein [Vicinamibacterales bacterium]
MPIPADPKAPKDDIVECPACHAKVKKEELTRVGGRMLCPGCAASWFDADDDQEKEKD